MADSEQSIMHQRTESIEAKTKLSSTKRHLANNPRHRESIRRTWSPGLPSLATTTVNMVVATINIGAAISNLTEDIKQNSNEHVYDDDDTINIGEQIQAHIPDIVLNNLNLLVHRDGTISIPNERTYNNATLLFLDVSGFTALTEQYSNDAHSAIDQLTRTLNSYFAELVYEILAHDGDIYKFAGDAILALWINEITGPQQALKCALNLQEKCGAYETDVKVTLHLKVALAYGHIRALFVGTDEFKHYLLTGDCIKDVNICEQLCEPGDILLTKSIYHKLSSVETPFSCEFVPVSETIDPKHEHIAVKYSKSTELSVNETSIVDQNTNDSSLFADKVNTVNQDVINDGNNIFENRPNVASDSLIKSFLLRCVKERIEHKQSLDYLSELRRVTISFINLDMSNEQNTNENLYENIQKIFVTIYESTKMMGGVLTKALLFDKGWSFLCVFGLPGYKQGDDTANALKCAQMIHTKIRNQYKFVEKCSIGVTTGLTYCGVVGHVARCEYTVIGRKVNMAARLMCNYQNIISCDQETCYNSRLNNRFFQRLPNKPLKGMTDVGIIWEYDESFHLQQIIDRNKISNQEMDDMNHEKFPLLGRRVELMIVTAQIMLLDEPINSLHRRRDLAAIIFEGEDKIGRSRLLKFIAQSLQQNSLSPSHYDNTYIPRESSINSNNTLITTNDYDIGRMSSLNSYGSDSILTKRSSINVINFRCQFEQRFNEFLLLRSLLRQLLQFHNNDKSPYEREQYLLRLFDINDSNGLHLRRNLFLLNDLLDVKFRRSHTEIENINDQNLAKTYETNLNELILHILNKLIDTSNNSTNATNTCPSYLQARISMDSTTSSNSPTSIAIASKIIFIIDDIHFADQSSLRHLLTLGSHSKCLLILSMKPPKSNNKNNNNPTSEILHDISTDSRVYLRRLPGLELRYLATLGCQILSVHRIPTKLVKLFNESCNGIPGFCEQILYDLLSKKKIYIADNIEKHEQESILIDGDVDKLLGNSLVKMSLFKTLFSRRKQQITYEQRQHELTFSRICLLTNPNDDDLNVDCQQNFQNYIMCRIDRLSEGESFLVKIAAIIGNTFSRTFLLHFVDHESKKLININSCILEMMQRTIIECAFSKQQASQTRSIKCFCLQNPGGFPSQCRLMAFTHSTIREGIYNSLTDSLKSLLTRNAIDYLEKQSVILCQTCATNRIDNPFLVQEQDGLAKIVKNIQQQAFVDIVQMAALKEIDIAIKNLSRLTNSPIRPRSNSSVYGLNNSLSTSNSNTNNSNENNNDKRRKSCVINRVEVERSRRISTQYPPIIKDHSSNEDSFDRKSTNELKLTQNDPRLTLVSVFTHDESPNVEVNVQRSNLSIASKSSQVVSVFKLPKTQSATISLPTVELSATNDESSSNENKISNKKLKHNKTNRLMTFFRRIFCRFVPINAHATVVPTTETPTADDTTQTSANNIMPQVDNNSKENENTTRNSSNWKKVRKAILPTQGKMNRTTPGDDELLDQQMYSIELTDKLSSDLNRLNQQTSSIRTFESLYYQSNLVFQFQSYTHYKNLIHYVYDSQKNQANDPDFNKFLCEFQAYSDLRICECVDYLINVYIKLLEYHTNLYEMHEKSIDEKRNLVCIKLFRRIMYYRIEICYLLLRCNCLQRLLVEIENGRKILEKFHNDKNNKDNFPYEYEYFIIKHTYDLFQAILLQRTRAINDSKQICEQNLKELNEAYETKIWEKLISYTDTYDISPINELNKDNSFDNYSNSQSTSNLTQYHLFDGKYRLEYLLCQYYLLQYNLVRHHLINSINQLIDLEYYKYPLTFSISCTITLVEYYFSQMNYNQCLMLINKIIHFWWPFTSPREKLEFAKLKCLSLIIELKQGSLDSAILSGYFSKRLLTGFHENVFLIQSCIHLTLALIGEMRTSNIELVLQHLEYLSELAMNCYAKLWYYILVLDTAIELGYELLPITNDLLDNITKYRKKLHSGPKERSLVLFYSDCTLAQLYARLGLLEMSKIHFHQAIHHIKHDQMHLSNTDFRLKRAVLKLVETQLLHWYYTNEHEQYITINYFLLNYFNDINSEKYVSWNRTRIYIYRAYYDRLINDYRKEKNYSIDNNFNWKINLCEAEKYAVKLDLEWIKRLKSAWVLSVSEQISAQEINTGTNEQLRRSTLPNKPNHRCFIRLSVPYITTAPSKAEMKTEKHIETRSQAIDNYSYQRFVDWRSSLKTNNNHSSQFQLFILPVRV